MRAAIVDRRYAECRTNPVDDRNEFVTARTIRGAEWLKSLHSGHWGEKVERL